MKTCQICLRQESGNNATCPACGEASWGVPSVVAAPSPPLDIEPPIFDEPEPSAPSPKGKRSK